MPFTWFRKAQKKGPVLVERRLTLESFILPGGSEAASRCHMARTVARRAERRVISLARVETVNEATIRYLNRLSDLLFVIARMLARRDGGSEVLWVHGDKR